ncbi:MAG: enoyl-CoA hydratase/isomerase family protein [candidate division NC10 bacterium]|nr:enoyl-CoA hydratase/isomerase family protein [candidate division NC10 bacterium]
MGFETILLKIEGGVATVTLNRPQQLNALNRQMFRELDEAFEEVATDPAARVLVITGAGDRAFAAGADIREFVGMGPVAALDFSRNAQRIFRTLETMPKPTVAAVNGFALGGGCELMMACDIAYAADTAKVGQPEITLGIIPGAGGTQRLSRLVGKQKAKELMMTGDMIPAEEALRLGLVCKVVPAAGLMPEVQKLCEKLLSKGDVALRMVKEAVEAGTQVDLASGTEIEAKAWSLCFTTEDYVEGVKAFLEKRKASFKGR